jgi:monoamine oxidase
MPVADVFVTRWSSEPYIGGAYSTLGVGATPADRTALEAVLGQRMTFAGEHLSVDYPATMHGAYNSGVAAAQRLLAAQPEAETAIVVGAGLSGLAAAQILKSAGLSVTVLEATSKIGGRARTESIWDNRPIHPGAAWVHGPIGNPIAELARSVHISFPPEPPHVRHVVVSSYRQAGEVRRFGSAVALDSASAEQVLAATKQAHDALNHQAEQHRDSGQADTTVKPVLQSILREIEDLSLRAAVGTQLVQHFESLLAGSIDDISLHFGDEPYAYPGGDHYITTPLEPLIAKLTEDLRVELESPVTKVEFRESCVHITSARDHTADLVVVALPLIPLQREAIAFCPTLPDALLASLHRLRMGSKTKVFVRFTAKWWGDTHTLWMYPSAPANETDFSEQRDPTASPLWSEWVDATDVAGVPTLFVFLSGSEGQRIAELALTPEGLAQVRAEVENLFRVVEPALCDTPALPTESP